MRENTPGSENCAPCVLKEMAKYSATGGMSTRFDIFIEANNIIPLEETF